MSHASVIIASICDQHASVDQYGYAWNGNPGATFMRLLNEALESGLVIIDNGGKCEPEGLVVGHWLPDWEAMPIYPEPCYRIVARLSEARGMALIQPEQVWSDLEETGVLTRSWNGKPLTVRWRGNDIDAFILSLSAFGLEQETPDHLNVTRLDTDESQQHLYSC
ncbi:MAG: hypothetical protein HC837_04360 [Chloroflexaceae bacterium]|nr:hypothetical protein [Chloroflexaceae bacterium]